MISFEKTISSFSYLLSQQDNVWHEDLCWNRLYVQNNCVYTLLKWWVIVLISHGKGGVSYNLIPCYTKGHSFLYELWIAKKSSGVLGHKERQFHELSGNLTTILPAGLLQTRQIFFVLQPKNNAKSNVHSKSFQNCLILYSPYSCTQG